MKINVKNIPEDGLVINQEIAPESIGLSEDDIHLSSPLLTSGKVERLFDSVLARIEMLANYTGSCSLCLCCCADRRRLLRTPPY